MTCVGYDFRFPLKADIFYATSTQNSIGEMDKTWTLGGSDIPCELRTDKFNSDTRYAMSMRDPFMETPLLVFGRFKMDIRALSGSYVAPTDIVVTNIRSFCENQPLFIETFMEPPFDTIFELRTFQPFVNPWGQIEYYKTQLTRVEDQEEILEGIV